MPRKGQKLSPEHKAKLMEGKRKKRGLSPISTSPIGHVQLSLVELTKPDLKQTMTKYKEPKIKLEDEYQEIKVHIPKKERRFGGDWNSFLTTLVKRSKKSTRLVEYERIIKQADILCEGLKYFFHNSDRATSDELLIFADIIGEILESIQHLLTDEITAIGHF